MGMETHLLYIDGFPKRNKILFSYIFYSNSKEISFSGFFFLNANNS